MVLKKKKKDFFEEFLGIALFLVGFSVLSNRV